MATGMATGRFITSTTNIHGVGDMNAAYVRVLSGIDEKVVVVGVHITNDEGEYNGSQDISIFFGDGDVHRAVDKVVAFAEELRMKALEAREKYERFHK